MKKETSTCQKMYESPVVSVRLQPELGKVICASQSGNSEQYDSSSIWDIVNDGD